jgi:hypothetical protein
MGATSGDLMARDVVCNWLEEMNVHYDIALAPPFNGGVDWEHADPSMYSHVIFVCGPFGKGSPITEFLSRYKENILIGVNLSMLENLSSWNPFDYLIERDSSERTNPEISFLSTQSKVPVVGVILVHPQEEYGKKARHKIVNEVIQQFIQSNEFSIVHIDTRLDVNKTHLRSPSEVESIIAKMDVVLTTRLHGMVLALKNNVPAIAIDPISGGAKILKQANTIEWPIVFQAGVTVQELQKAYQYCLTGEAKKMAEQCGKNARRKVLVIKENFISILKTL